MPGKVEKSYYDVLGVARNASEDEIKKAYHKLALKEHPDRKPAAERDAATQKFQVIANAKDVLTDSAQRREYDRTLNDTAPAQKQYTAPKQQYRSTDSNNYRKEQEARAQQQARYEEQARQAARDRAQEQARRARAAEQAHRARAQEQTQYTPRPEFRRQAPPVFQARPVPVQRPTHSAEDQLMLILLIALLRHQQQSMHQRVNIHMMRNPRAHSSSFAKEPNPFDELFSQTAPSPKQAQAQAPERASQQMPKPAVKENLFSQFFAAILALLMLKPEQNFSNNRSQQQSFVGSAFRNHCASQANSEFNKEDHGFSFSRPTVS